MIRPFFRLAIVINLLALAPVPGAPATTAPATAPPAATLLDRAGQRVQQFWDELSSVTCTEHLAQEKFNEKGKTLLRSQSDYDYLISMRWSGGELLVDESRAETSAPARKAPQGSLLATRGFATLLLILHPEFQSSYFFSPQAEAEIEGRKLVPVTFVPRTGGKSPGALDLKGREYPIAWEGTAWIEPASGMVARIEAHWREPAEEIGLETLSTDVRYAPVSLRAKTYWLPQSAQIEVKTRHQHWRNLHRFAAYKLFAVETETKIEEKH